MHPVDPALKNAQDYPLAPLDLRIDGETLKLEPQMGALQPVRQSVCHVDKERGYPDPLGPDEVAKISFFEGGSGGYLVRRVGNRFALLEWSQTDGACNDPKTNDFIPCPIHEKPARTLALPADAEIVQRVILRDATGEETPLDCSRDFEDQSMLPAS